MKKKNILSWALAVALGFTSCDMDQEPYTAYPIDKYMVNMTQFVDASQGLYTGVRSMTTSSSVLAPEFQTELFLPTVFFSNTYGDVASWQIYSSSGTPESIWASYYAMIASANFIIDSYDKAAAGERGEFTAQELAVCKTVAGEAYFARAYSYFNLALLFCDSYDAAKADQQLGLPLQLKYAPSQNPDTYPGRASLAATYKQILEDIKMCYDYVVSQPDASQQTITQDVVRALDARISLHMKDYNRAISCATTLINSHQYPLAASFKDLARMWTHDEGTEFIWKLYQNYPFELGGALGYPFQGQYMAGAYNQQRMDFIPSMTLLTLYAENDYRFPIYFREFPLDYWFGVDFSTYTFNKFPGNAVFQAAQGVSSDNWYTNISKPFSIAEQYLIAAECYTERNKAGDLEKGAQLLNELRASRHQNYETEQYADQAEQREQVRQERMRELVGEGFHLYDLKRWNKGFDRTGTSHIQGFENQLPYFNKLKIEAGDYRFTWPIPKTEIDANPQLKGQQNSGY